MGEVSVGAFEASRSRGYVKVLEFSSSETPPPTPATPPPSTSAASAALMKPRAASRHLP